MELQFLGQETYIQKSLIITTNSNKHTIFPLPISTFFDEKH